MSTSTYPNYWLERERRVAYLGKNPVITTSEDALIQYSVDRMVAGSIRPSDAQWRISFILGVHRTRGLIETVMAFTGMTWCASAWDVPALRRAVA